MVIGFLVAGAIGQRRAEQFERLRARDGFVEHMLEVIEPRDDAQRGEILPFIQETARRNREIVEGSRTELSAELDSLRSRLNPLLDPEQMERLVEEGRLRNVFRRPGGGPRGRPPREPGASREPGAERRGPPE